MGGVRQDFSRLPTLSVSIEPVAREFCARLHPNRIRWEDFAQDIRQNDTLAHPKLLIISPQRPLSHS